MRELAGGPKGTAAAIRDPEWQAWTTKNGMMERATICAVPPMSKEAKLWAKLIQPTQTWMTNPFRRSRVFRGLDEVITRSPSKVLAAVISGCPRSCHWTKRLILRV